MLKTNWMWISLFALAIISGDIAFLLWHKEQPPQPQQATPIVQKLVFSAESPTRKSIELKDDHSCAIAPRIIGDKILVGQNSTETRPESKAIFHSDNQANAIKQAQRIGQRIVYWVQCSPTDNDAFSDLFHGMEQTCHVHAATYGKEDELGSRIVFHNNQGEMYYILKEKVKTGMAEKIHKLWASTPTLFTDRIVVGNPNGQVSRTKASPERMSQILGYRVPITVTVNGYGDNESELPLRTYIRQEGQLTRSYLMRIGCTGSECNEVMELVLDANCMPSRYTFMRDSLSD